MEDDDEHHLFDEQFGQDLCPPARLVAEKNIQSRIKWDDHSSEFVAMIRKKQRAHPHRYTKASCAHATKKPKMHSLTRKKHPVVQYMAVDYVKLVESLGNTIMPPQTIVYCTLSLEMLPMCALCWILSPLSKFRKKLCSILGPLIPEIHTIITPLF